MRNLAVAGIVASFAFAAPAMAQEPAVGEPQIVTDQATETEPAPPEPGVAYDEDGSDVPSVDDGTPAPEPAPDASGRRGEIHVLDATSASSPSAAATTPRPAATGARTLPFTGVNAGLLALVGLALLAAGVGLRRQLPLRLRKASQSRTQGPKACFSTSSAPRTPSGDALQEPQPQTF